MSLYNACLSGRRIPLFVFVVELMINSIEETCSRDILFL